MKIVRYGGFAVVFALGCSTVSADSGTDTDGSTGGGASASGTTQGGTAASTSASTTGTSTTMSDTDGPEESASESASASATTSTGTAETDPSSGSDSSSGGSTGPGSSSDSGSSSTGPECTRRCDDGEFCNGVEICDPLNSKEESGCVRGRPPCAKGIVCDEEEDECVEERRVFVTNATFTGDLAGVLAADGICQTTADTAALGGAWRAYIVDPANPIDRHNMYDVPYVRLDGTVVASSWEDLHDESILAPLNVDENGMTVTGNAWTGFLNVPGSPTGNNWCENWSAPIGDCLGSGICGAAGELAAIDNHWDGFFVFNCSDLHHLYCIEQ